MSHSSMRVYVFGDQTFDIADQLSTVIRSHEDALVQDFVERSCRVLKQEIGRLESQQAEACPRFSKLLDLVPHVRAGTLNPALAQALTCITHLGTFIKDHGYATDSKPYPTAQDSCLAGLCTGLITAAAVSYASSVSELVVFGLQSVAVAFRVGAMAWDVRDRLASDTGDTGQYLPWTAAILGLSPEEVYEGVKNFCIQNGSNATSSPWISAHVGPVQMSISAPPAILARVLAFPPFASRVFAKLPVTAPYHAPHLFSEADIDDIVSDLPSLRVQDKSKPIPIISEVSGELIALSDFTGCLHSVAGDALLRRLRWDLVPKAIAIHLQNAGCTDFIVHTIATCSAERIQPAIYAHVQTLARSSMVSNSLHLRSVGNQHISQPPSRAMHSKIAIVGCSGRFPQANSMDAFWDVLSRGVDTHELVPSSRWDHRSHVSATAGKNVSSTGFGCWLHDAAAFDARFFNMSPREAPQVDPAQRLALLTAAEALEQAGIVGDMTSSTKKNRVGVYFGATSNDWMETNSAQNIDTYFIPGGNRAFIPGRINYHFKFSGPSYTIDTACSSSMTAIQLACNALWRGEVDTAIVGGTNVLTNPDMTVGLDRGHFLSTTGNCKTFDESADGYCRGEAVVTAIFKRLDDAIADRDPIQACILAVGTNHSAEADSITRPHVAAQKDLIDSVLADAGVDATSISYVEMHGTGTQAGDAAETASVLDSLAPVARRKPTQPLYIGAAKANVGHGESAAGATSLAKILLMLKHSEIPPHCGIKTKINSKIPDLKPRETHIAKTAVPWPRPVNGVRRVLLNNFSAAGGNTALILEDPPEVEKTLCNDPRAHHVIAISAKTASSLQQNLKNMIAWMDRQPEDSSILPRLSYTTTARRNHYPHRVAVTASDLEQAKANLQQALDRGDGANRQKGTLKCVFSFTGQGSQFAGMGAELYSHFKSFRKDIIAYNQLSVGFGFPAIRPMFETADAWENATPTMTQLASVSLQMALCRLWQSFGVIPTSVVGHSLGEYPALYAAGVLSQADVLYVVGRRAQLLESLCEPGTHSMLAVRSSAAEIESVLGLSGAEYEISCINGSKSIVLGGTKGNLESLKPKLQSRGIATTNLDVAYAFHTGQVDPILDPLADATRDIQFAEPQIPIISPACGGVAYTAADLGSDFIVRHCRSAVKMVDALNAARNQGLIGDSRNVCIEVGPAMVVAKMVKEIAGSSLETFASMRSGDDTWKLLSQAMSRLYAAGMAVHWPAYHKDFEACQSILEIPSYGWELKDYWLQYVNDWSLRKGDPPLTITAPVLESSSIHKVVQDTLGKPDGQLILEADLSREDLHPMVQGHQVYGVPLCTPSVYADIALTVGQYIMTRLDPSGKSRAVEVADMTIQSALVANSDGLSQTLRAIVTIDEVAKTATCTFSSVDTKGKIIEQHSHCTLRAFDAAAVQKQWQISAPSILARMSGLKQQVDAESNTFRFSKHMIYKMIGKLADFDPNYRGLVEITLDNDGMEATGRVTFKDVHNNGKFHTNPAFIDALSQLGGFVMNANDRVDLDKEVFVNHGWGSLKFFRPISPDTQYYSYVKMTEGKNKLWEGDVVIFDEKEIVAVFGSVALQNVPKRLMEYIVGAANNKVAASSGKAVSKSADVLAAPAAPISTVSVQTHKQVTKTVETITDITQPSESGLFATAMKTISEESGIAPSELTDDCAFDDIGMDSLLCLMVSSRLRDELGVDIDSAKFLDLRTVSGLREYLAVNEPESVEPIRQQEQQQPQQQTQQGVIVNERIEEIQEQIVESRVVPAATSGAWTQILDIISEESGIATAELTDETAFADVGVDSLLSLLIWSRLKDEAGVDLEDTSAFLDFETIGSFRSYILGSSGSSDSGHDSSSTESSSTLGELTSDTPATQPSSGPSSVDGDTEPLELVKPAWSLVLQGQPKTASQRLFLFPDGCGAATSYMRLPRISNSTAVIAFNSPFMKNPQDMACRSLPEIVTSYITSVRKHQPHGPYHLGGWSAGGVIAYAVAQQLVAEGEEVASLQVLDSPPPTRGLDKLPDRFFDHCSEVGIFGNELMVSGEAASATANTKVPDWLMPHFRATIELLSRYVAPPFIASSDKQPRVSIVWAGTCAFDNGKYAPLPAQTSEDPDTEGMKFLTQQREDFGAGDWANLFPGNQLDVHVVENEHHFSMMRGEGAAKLAKFMRLGLGAEC